MRATTVVVMLGAVACAPIGATPSTPSGTATPPAISSPTPTPTTPTTPTPVVVEDRFVRELSSKVDVLFVVQDTAGMADLQADLVGNSPNFFDYFLGSGLDYHVGVVTTDLDDPARSGALVEAAGLEWIDADTPSPVEVFALLASVGDAGTATPQPLGAVYAALETERDLANAGFTREDARLDVIVVGDGDDATDPANLDPAGFGAWFDGLRLLPEEASLSCLVPDGSLATACADTAAAVGGLVVVGADDPEGISRLGLQAVGLVSAFPLSAVPDPATLEVVVEDVSGATLPFDGDDWTYDAVANTVTFLEYVPNRNSTVVITYVEAR